MSRMKSWMSWLSSEPTSRSHLQSALVERRLRTEADPVRATLPSGLQQRTLNALREIEPRRRAIDSFRQPSMVMSLTGMVAMIVLVTLISLNLSVRPAVNMTPGLIQTMSVPTPKSVQENVFESLRAFEAFAGVSVSEASMTDQYRMEAKHLWQDASKATNAILASMPKRLLPDGDRMNSSPNGI